MRITKLDGLRGVFSLMIVLFHYRENFLPEFLRQLFFIREAYTFVDFFFVLSGYVIAVNYNKLSTWFEFKVYIKKRFIRLFPLLFFTTTVVLIFDLIGNYYFPNLVANVDSLPTLLLRYLDTLCFTNATPILGSTSGINGVSWSISSEMISYLVFGVVSAISFKQKRSLILILVIISAVVFSVYNGSFINTGDYGFIRGLISFNLGYFVWKLSQKQIKIKNGFEYLIPVFLLLIFYIINKYLSGLEKEMFILAVIPLFFGLSILILLKTNGILSKWLSSKPMVFLGDISYSVYLNHALLVIVSPKVVFGILDVPENTITEITLLALTVIFTVFYSYLTFIYIELKGKKILSKLVFKDK
tara:strand:+ start:6288 stop:7361 length:1074 start_codon:yes stop_codon:yes gene_type:complete